VNALFTIYASMPLPRMDSVAHWLNVRTDQGCQIAYAASSGGTICIPTTFRHKGIRLSLRAYAFVSESGGDTNRAAAGRSVCVLAALVQTRLTS